jgi:hypothetical protein
MFLVFSKTPTSLSQKACLKEQHIKNHQYMLHQGSCDMKHYFSFLLNALFCDWYYAYCLDRRKEVHESCFSCVELTSE